MNIGYIPLFEDEGMGCGFWSLDRLRILTPNQNESYGKLFPNDNTDYLEFGSEAVSVCTFAIRKEDFVQENPSVYGDWEENKIEEGYFYGKDVVAPTVTAFFGLIVECINEF